MKSSNIMNSSSTFRWLCGILVMVSIHGVTCGCLSDDKRKLYFDQCQSGFLIKEDDFITDGSIGKFWLDMKGNECKSNDLIDRVKSDSRRVSIQFGEGCEIKAQIVTSRDDPEKIYVNGGKHVNLGDDLRYSIRSCALKWVKDGVGTKYLALKFIDIQSQNDKPIKGCGLYMGFDKEISSYVPQTTPPPTTAMTTTSAPRTPYHTGSHPQMSRSTFSAPSDPASQSFMEKNWMYFLFGGIGFVLLIILILLIVCLVKRRKGNRQRALEEGRGPKTKMGKKEFTMRTARTAKGAETRDWNDNSESDDEPQTFNRGTQDVGEGYENLRQLQDDAYFTPNQDVGAEYENLNELLGTAHEPTPLKKPEPQKKSKPQKKPESRKESELSETTSETSSDSVRS